MTVYWDSSALIRYFLAGKLAKIQGVTRSHSLAEFFSGLTGRGYEMRMKDGTVRKRKLSLGAGVKVTAALFEKLTFVDLTPVEQLAAIERAKAVNAPGGRVHDLIHAAAAEKARADELWTLDAYDFSGLSKVPVKVLKLEYPVRDPRAA